MPISVLRREPGGDLVVRARVSALTRLSSLACVDRDGAAMPAVRFKTDALENDHWVLSAHPGPTLGRIELKIYDRLRAGVATATSEDIPLLGALEARARHVRGAWRELPLPTAFAIAVRVQLEPVPAQAPPRVPAPGPAPNAPPPPPPALAPAH